MFWIPVALNSQNSKFLNHCILKSLISQSSEFSRLHTFKSSNSTKQILRFSSCLHLPPHLNSIVFDRAKSFISKNHSYYYHWNDRPYLIIIIIIITIIIIIIIIS